MVLKIFKTWTYGFKTTSHWPLSHVSAILGDTVCSFSGKLERMIWCQISGGCRWWPVRHPLRPSALGWAQSQRIWPVNLRPQSNVHIKLRHTCVTHTLLFTLFTFCPSRSFPLAHRTWICISYSLDFMFFFVLLWVVLLSIGFRV